jgi:type VI secretion system secreted protein VgrG
MTATALLTEQNIWVTTPLPDGTLVLEEMSGRESLGAPFSYELALMSLNPNIDLTGLLGQPMTVYVTLPEGERQFNGIVTHAEISATVGDRTRYRVTLRPWLSLLAYTSNCRIFQDKSVVDIVKEVFRDNGFSDLEDALNDTYAPLEFCVQYRESDFNFVSRLMEHEGIYYYFKHEDEKHTLVLADGYSAHDTVDGYETVPYKTQNDFGVDEDYLHAWTVAQQIRPGSFASTDYDFTRPRADLLSQLSMPFDNAQADRALFDYPGDFLTADAGNTRVKVRLQENQVSYGVAQTAGNARGLGAGALFTLADFPRGDQNKEYLVIAAQYQLHASILETGGGQDDDDFRSHLTVIDSQTQFRPGLHAPKPRVEGPQTATVVGESGDEITVDQYGRVKVQFRWDREGQNDEDSSCWVRVAQLWAGSGWGGIHIPRIGQEVIVDFLEGDPDRPIITGRVYNADNMPPYALPANKTQSGIKSRSTQGGAPSNFNEIRFEDKKGSEDLHIQAEKDQSTNVKHSQSISVGADRSISVGGNESTSVTGTRSATITKKETQTFNDARAMTVAKDDTETITGKHTETIHGGRVANVDQGDKLTVNGSDKTDIIHGKYDITADTEFQVTQGSNTVLVKDSVDVNSVGEIHLHNPKSSVDLKDGILTISSATQIVLECGSAKLVLKNDGTITIDGSQEVKATGGGSGVDLVAAGATMSGTKATVSGTAMTEITGGLVKIN